MNNITRSYFLLERGCLLNLAFQPVAHSHEGAGCLAHLGGTGRLEVGRVPSFAEILRRRGEAPDRADLVAHEQGRDTEQDERGPDHPEDEDLCRRTDQAFLVRRDLEDTRGQLHVDQDTFGLAARVDHEGSLDDFLQRTGKCDLKVAVRFEMGVRQDRIPLIDDN